MADHKPNHAAGGTGDGASPQRTASRMRYKPWLLLIAGLLLLAWLVHWVWFRWTHVYLDDARIGGEVITLSSRVSGWITELPVIQG